MKAGRELDALVAETFFGGVDAVMFGWLLSPRREKLIPRYSADIEEAWRVVEEMRTRTYTLELYSPGALVNDEMGIYSHSGWRAVFMSWKRISELRAGDDTGETAAHAICLAALAAVGVEVTA